MKKIVYIFLLLPQLVWAQKTTIIKGFVKNSQNQSIENVSVQYDDFGTSTDKRGYYEIRIPIKTSITLEFSHVGYKSLTKDFYAKKRIVIRFSPYFKI